MNAFISLTDVKAPVRLDTIDDQAAVLRFAAMEARQGGAALATLVEIRGGAARALGAHIAVAADGRFCGYVSGGCVEAAVAAEAIAAIAARRDRFVIFGEGSPFFDIELPCGGGITIAIHVVRRPEVIERVLRRLDRRQEAFLLYRFYNEMLEIPGEGESHANWQNGEVLTTYSPGTLFVISGQGGEAAAVQRLAQASGFEAVRYEPSMDLSSVTCRIDRFTAVVLLHHDLDAEAPVLARSLQSSAFYIGALGSARTHGRRLARLREQGIAPSATERIKAPIGLFGPARDTTSLAISVLADVASARLNASVLKGGISSGCG